MSRTGDHDNTQSEQPGAGRDEQPGIAIEFARDPLAAARRAMLRAAREAARRGAASECEALSREAAAAELVALATPEDETRGVAMGHRFTAMSLLAETPGGSIGDAACKLAILVRQMTSEGAFKDALPAAHVALAASALADLVVLRAGPLLPLPDGCGAPIATAEDVARWREAAVRSARGS